MREQGMSMGAAASKRIVGEMTGDIRLINYAICAHVVAARLVRFCLSLAVVIPVGAGRYASTIASTPCPQTNRTFDRSTGHG